MPRILPAESWLSRDTPALARELIGCWLCVQTESDEVVRRRITETEAYDGPDDRACHAHKGRTQRTEVMFGPPGVWYVYLCYGIHEMLNLVTGPPDYPAAILIRGVEQINGPGRLTKRLGIDRRFNSQRATRATCLWIESEGNQIPNTEVEATPRIGINYAGPEWAAKPWRFVWKQ